MMKGQNDALDPRKYFSAMLLRYPLQMLTV